MPINCRLLFNSSILFYGGKKKAFFSSPIMSRNKQSTKQARKELASFLYLNSKRKQSTV